MERTNLSAYAFDRAVRGQLEAQNEVVVYAAPSCRELDIFSNDPRMARGDAEQCDRGSLRLSPALLPVAERVDADAHGASELGLREPHEAPQGRDVVTGFESARHETLPKASRNRSRKLCIGQLGDVRHDRSSNRILSSSRSVHATNTSPRLIGSSQAVAAAVGVRSHAPRYTLVRQTG